MRDLSDDLWANGVFRSRVGESGFTGRLACVGPVLARFSLLLLKAELIVARFREVSLDFKTFEPKAASCYDSKRY